MSGELKKMVIEAYRLADRSDSKPEVFEVMFNPNTYNQKYEVRYEEVQAKGTTGSPQVYSRTKPQEYTFELLFDGTGTAAKKVEVHAKVQRLLTVTGTYRGDKHRPRYLRLSWGSLIADCVLKSADVTYTLFRADGKALRAKVKATFAESIEDLLRVKKERSNSPDLTHVHEVKAGERLPQLAQRYYGDAARYLQVARFNNLSRYRLTVGQRLVFPPIREAEA